MSLVQQRSLEHILNAGKSYEVAIQYNNYDRIYNLLVQVRVARFHVTHIHDSVNTLVERVFGGEFKWEKKKI